MAKQIPWLRRLFMAEVQQSWTRFFTGLVCFVVGVLVMVFGVHWHDAFYYIGLVILLLGFVVAMLGYLGIFIDRIKSMKVKR
jgi:peptidoglycan/LPS O-acetylase OafA/YrhL